MLNRKLSLNIFIGALIIGLIVIEGYVLFYPKPTSPRRLSQTRLTLTYSPTEINPSETVTIKGNLEYLLDPWEPFTDQDVNLYYAETGSGEWTLIGAATTNIEGEFVYILIPNLPPGKYALKANYTGGKEHNPCQTELQPVPKGILVIPEIQHGPIIAIIIMLTALCFNAKYYVNRKKWISNT